MFTFETIMCPFQKSLQKNLETLSFIKVFYSKSRKVFRKLQIKLFPDIFLCEINSDKERFFREGVCKSFSLYFFTNFVFFLYFVLLILVLYNLNNCC